MQIALVVILLMTLSGCMWLVSFSSTRQDRDRAVYFMYATLALSFYVLGNLSEVLATTPEGAMAALRVQNAGIPVIAPLFMLCMISVFYPSLMRKWMLPAVIAYGIAMLVVVLFNDRHMLYYTSIEMMPMPGGGQYLQLGHGPLYVLQHGIGALCILIAYTLAVRRSLGGTKNLRSQMWLMFAGSGISIVASVMNIFHILPYGIDPTPIAITLSMILFSFGLTQHKLMDLVPIASSSAVRTMEDAIVVLDEQLALQNWNLSAARLFPQLAGCVTGDNVNRLAAWPEELRAQTVPGEITFCLPDAQGTDHYFRARISQVLNQKNEMMGWSYVMRDITENVNMMQQLEELATTDPLTGIYNRRQFMHMVNHEMEVAARLHLHTALIMYDLDHFKDVNDTYGHLAGDYILCAIANILKNQLRPYDIFARYGGEEFVIFTTSNEEFDVYAFADRLRERIERSEISYDGNHIPITASFGVTLIPPKVKFKDAMRAVDTALYKAKAKGRNRVVMAEDL